VEKKLPFEQLMAVKEVDLVKVDTYSGTHLSQASCQFIHCRLEPGNSSHGMLFLHCEAVGGTLKDGLEPVSELVNVGFDP
jgi:hypothetical protein